MISRFLLWFCLTIWLQIQRAFYRNRALGDQGAPAHVWGLSEGWGSGRGGSNTQPWTWSIPLHTLFNKGTGKGLCYFPRVFQELKSFPKHLHFPLRVNFRKWFNFLSLAKQQNEHWHLGEWRVIYMYPVLPQIHICNKSLMRYKLSLFPR